MKVSELTPGNTHQEQQLRAKINLCWEASEAIRAAYEVGIYGILDHLTPGKKRVVFAIDEHFAYLVDELELVLKGVKRVG